MVLFADIILRFEALDSAKLIDTGYISYHKAPTVILNNREAHVTVTKAVKEQTKQRAVTYYNCTALYVQYS